MSVNLDLDAPSDADRLDRIIRLLDALVELAIEAERRRRDYTGEYLISIPNTVAEIRKELGL